MFCQIGESDWLEMGISKRYWEMPWYTFGWFQLIYATKFQFQRIAFIVPNDNIEQSI